MLRRPYQKVLVALILRPRSLLPLRLVDYLRASAQPVLSRGDRRARPDAADRLLRPDIARPRRLPRDRRVHDRHSARCMSARRSGCRAGSRARPAPLLGFIVGLPSLRFRGVYLAISTLAMHYAIIFLRTSYQANFGSSATAGITIPDPVARPVRARRRSRLVLLPARAGRRSITVGCVNLCARVRAVPGWRSATATSRREALGINLARYKLLAFVVSSTLASLVRAACWPITATSSRSKSYTLDLAIIYVAMIIVGGMGSILGAVLGAIFMTLLPFGDRCAVRRSAALLAIRLDAVRRAGRRGRGLHHRLPAVRAEGPDRDLATASRPISSAGRSAIGRSTRAALTR